MTLQEYNQLRPGDRIEVVVNRRPRIMRITHWENRIACGNLKPLNKRLGWCRGTYKAEPFQVCEKTYDVQTQQMTIADVLSGGAA